MCCLENFGGCEGFEFVAVLCELLLAGETPGRGMFFHYDDHLEDNMATLNIKNFPQELYKNLQERARRQRRSVAQEVTRLLATVLETSEPLSILELRGLGKEIWEAVDPAAHVDSEQSSWD